MVLFDFNGVDVDIGAGAGTIDIPDLSTLSSGFGEITMFFINIFNDFNFHSLSNYGYLYFHLNISPNIMIYKLV